MGLLAPEGRFRAVLQGTSPPTRLKVIPPSGAALGSKPFVASHQPLTQSPSRLRLSPSRLLTPVGTFRCGPGSSSTRGVNRAGEYRLPKVFLGLPILLFIDSSIIHMKLLTPLDQFRQSEADRAAHHAVMENLPSLHVSIHQRGADAQEASGGLHRWSGPWTVRSRPEIPRARGDAVVPCFTGTVDATVRHRATQRQ